MQFIFRRCSILQLRYQLKSNSLFNFGWNRIELPCHILREIQFSDPLSIDSFDWILLLYFCLLFLSLTELENFSFSLYSLRFQQCINLKKAHSLFSQIPDIRHCREIFFSLFKVPSWNIILKHGNLKCFIYLMKWLCPGTSWLAISVYLLKFSDMLPSLFHLRIFSSPVLTLLSTEILSVIILLCTIFIYIYGLCNYEFTQSNTTTTTNIYKLFDYFSKLKAKN